MLTDVPSSRSTGQLTVYRAAGQHQAAVYKAASKRRFTNTVRKVTGYPEDHSREGGPGGGEGGPRMSHQWLVLPEDNAALPPSRQH